MLWTVYILTVPTVDASFVFIRETFCCVMYQIFSVTYGITYVYELTVLLNTSKLDA